MSKSADVFRGLIDEIDSALKKAEKAHTGRAADAANASIAEIKPIAENAAKTAEEVSSKLAEQNQNQHGTFYSLPARGGRLSDGRQTQMEPPEKNWAERHGVDNIPGLGWSSHYEEKQARFQATNDEAEQAMSRYNSQTANTTGSLPEFEPPDDYGRTGSDQGDYGQGAGEIMDGTSYGSGSGSAGTSSAWASAPSGAGAGAGAGAGGFAAGGSYTSSGSNAAAAPAGTGSAWSTPSGTVRGPDGTLYRQGPDGSWQRQNPYNGRWAPTPQGPPGGAGGSAGGGARGGGATPRGGAGAGGGFGPRGSGSSELAPGGRSGTGSFGPKGSGTTPTTAGGGGGTSGGRGGNGMMRGAGGGGAQQGGEEEEHERPSWLMETEDVFTNDMQRVAPPVIGETPYEQGN